MSERAAHASDAPEAALDREAVGAEDEPEGEPEDDEDDPEDDFYDQLDDDAGNRALGGIPLAVLDFVVRSIVDDPESVFIDADERRGRLELTVSVAPPDTGKVIGRRGHVVQAIRTLVGAAGARDNLVVLVEIAD